MSFQLRDYQATVCDAIEQDWLFGGNRATFVDMATGLGKTEVFVEVARRSSNLRTLVICPMVELIGQAAKKFLKRTGVMPDIEQADLMANETSWGKNQFVVASKQTLCKERRGGFRYQRFTDIGIVVVDECHLSITKPYKDMLDWFMDRGANVLGVTATSQRLDKRSMRNVYDNCAYQYGITDAVPDGWLVPCKASSIQIQSMDLSKLKLHGGDFKEHELASILEEEETMLEIAAVTARESEGLKTVVYCASVDEAKGIANILTDRYKVRADWVCADEQRCTKQRRKEVLDSFTGDPNGVMIVCNVGVLTTGWDFPALQHIVMARPTNSIALYSQIFGRGTRPLEGTVDFDGSTPDLRRDRIASSLKPHFKMTDLVDNSLKHKIITAANVMGGRMGIEVVQRAQAEMLNGAAVSVDEALSNAAKRLQEEKEEAERKRRAAIRPDVQYQSVSVDPYDQYSRGGNVQQKKQQGPRMLFGKHKGKLLTEIPVGYLKWFDQECKTKPWLQTAVKVEIERRANDSPSSRRQSPVKSAAAPSPGFVPTLSPASANQSLMASGTRP